MLPRILKLATEQIEKQPGEAASIADKETTTEPEPTTQTRTNEMHLPQLDVVSLNGEENSTVTANQSNTTVSTDGQHGSSSSLPAIPISFQFTPSQKWIADIQSDIDLDTIQALLSVLAPQVTTCVCV